MMKFIDDFKKDLNKSGIQEGSSQPPRYWYSTGNYVLNKIISGSFYKGIPQGRIVCFTGPSGAGKSFLAANAMREAQQKGAYVVVLDSENALDDDFTNKIGVDTNNNYTYVPVDTIPQCKKVVSSFIKGYKSEYGDDPNAPQVLLVVDSLDMLITETEQEHFDKGVTKGDQGQRSKQLKAMLREFVQAVKRPNMSMIVTAQVYKNQDVMNGEGVWIVSDAIKFSLSQIVLLTKLKLRDVGDREVKGIRMKCEGYKSRFTRPMQNITIEVPYETGMDPYNGLLNVAVEMGVITQVGARYKISDQYINDPNIQITPPYDKSWYAKDFNGISKYILGVCESQQGKFLDALIQDDEVDLTPQLSARKQRMAKHTS